MLLDVGREADLLHARRVTGPRAKTEPIQHVRHGARIGFGRDGRSLGPLGTRRPLESVNIDASATTVTIRPGVKDVVLMPN